MDKTVAAHLSRHDREIAAIRKLLLAGMKILTRMESRMDQRMDRLEGEQDALRKDMRELAAEGRETERRLKGLIRALERGGNGRGPSR